MLYDVDIKREIFDIKTFTVEADNESDANERAMEQALNTLWTMQFSNRGFSVLNTTERNKE